MKTVERSKSIHSASPLNPCVELKPQSNTEKAETKFFLFFFFLTIYYSQTSPEQTHSLCFFNCSLML